MNTDDIKTVTANIRLERGLLAALDFEAGKDRRSRNSLIVQILEAWVLGLPVVPPSIEDRKRAGEKIGKLVMPPGVVKGSEVKVGESKKTAVAGRSQDEGGTVYDGSDEFRQ